MNLSIDSLFVYPLKSGARLPVEHVSLNDRGLYLDRHFMLVKAQPDASGVFRFISQRDRGMEILSQMMARPYEGHMMFHMIDSGEAFVIDYANNAKRENVFVSVHKSEMMALDCGGKAARFFSEKLNTDCRLIAFDESVQRIVDQEFGSDRDHTAFADGFPLLVTNQASLDALNAEMDQADRVEMSRFRPNIVLKGLAPFEEDTIKELQIGDTIIEFVKPCTRCVLTTVDQDLAAKPSKEPMATLAKVRRGMDQASGLKGVFFGQNAVPRQLGDINVTDEVKILSRKTMHPAVQQAKLKFGA